MITLAEHVVAPQPLSFPEQTEVFALSFFRMSEQHSICAQR
ncbi:hypothetical protein [Mesorhizobium sp. M1295]